ncbi:MAG: ATP-binding protein, partial [Planctomycetota bacterium]|nr:ATP-binding protein [Planctomycetota bacterium]
IATSNVKGADAGHSLPPGDYVCVTVRDTGTGIDKETLVHIFDPFFTTKPDGRGTGLGLAMVYSFVKLSRGFIYVESEPGRGTTFFLYFRHTTAPVPVARMPRLALSLQAGTETVLVAEDDDDLRTLTVRLLHDSGYNVLAARNSMEALSLGREYAGAIDVLIADVVMPGMSGPAMAAQFRGTHQETQVLYVSGHARGVPAGLGLQNPTDHLLAKPFGYHALAEKVRRIIDSRKAASGARAPQPRKQSRKIKVLA